MQDKHLQKSLRHFMLDDGGGAWLGTLSPLPLPAVVYLLQVMVCDSVVQCKQADVAKALAVSLRTVNACFAKLLSLGIVSKIRRGVYSLATYEQAVDIRNGCAQVADIRNGCAQVADIRNGCVDGAGDSAVDTLSNILLLRSSSSAHARASTTPALNKKEKVELLERLIVRNLGQGVWQQSTAWHEMLERAAWDMEVITDAVVAYADKVIGSGQKHQFSRLYNFVTREVENRRRRVAMQQQARPNYRPTELVSKGAKITEDQVRQLKGFLND